MLGLRSTLLPLLACAGLFVASAAGDTLYANLSGSFGILDPTSGAFTSIGTSPNIFGMGFAPDGTLYAMDGNTPAGVNKVDPLTGNTTLQFFTTDTATGATVGGDGLIYVVNSNLTNASLYTIDPNSHAVHVISAGLGFGTDGLAVFANGVFYTDTSGAGANDVLESVDLGTGVATAIGTGMGTQIFAGANVNGVVYGGAQNGNLYTIDLATGVANFDAIIGSTGDVFALASIPEPSTTMLAGAGTALMGLVFAVRRRRPRS